MLTRNIDVADGLVNGVQGTVVGFTHRNNNQAEPIVAVLVRFYSPNTGHGHRQKHPCNVPGAVSISHQENIFLLYKKGAIEVSRKQFPL